jgi:hypothetical protein
MAVDVLIQYSLHGVLGPFANSCSHGPKTYLLFNLMYDCVQTCTLPEPGEYTRHTNFSKQHYVY